MVSIYVCFKFLNVGIPIIILFEVEPVNIAVTINALNLINEDGMLLQSVPNITDLGTNRFGAGFLPPSVTFQIQVFGTDENGYNFLRTSDTSVTVTAINLIMSKCINNYEHTVVVHNRDHTKISYIKPLKEHT